MDLWESIYPSMRNCPGAGKLSCTESFSNAKSDGQLSTRLDTGILQEIKLTCVYLHRKFMLYT